MRDNESAAGPPSAASRLCRRARAPHRFARACHAAQLISHLSLAPLSAITLPRRDTDATPQSILHSTACEHSSCPWLQGATSRVLTRVRASQTSTLHYNNGPTHPGAIVSRLRRHWTHRHAPCYPRADNRLCDSYASHEQTRHRLQRYLRHAAAHPCTHVATRTQQYQQQDHHSRSSHDAPHNVTVHPPSRFGLVTGAATTTYTVSYHGITRRLPRHQDQQPICRAARTRRLTLRGTHHISTPHYAPVSSMASSSTSTCHKNHPARVQSAHGSDTGGHAVQLTVEGARKRRRGRGGGGDVARFHHLVWRRRA